MKRMRGFFSLLFAAALLATSGALAVAVLPQASEAPVAQQSAEPAGEALAGTSGLDVVR